jgi:hypothetical protein
MDDWPIRRRNFMHPAYVSSSAQIGQQEEYPMNIVKALTVGTFLASTLVAGAAFAKGHDQGGGNNDKAGNAGFTDVADTVANTPSRNGMDGRGDKANARVFGEGEFPGRGRGARGMRGMSHMHDGGSMGGSMGGSQH